MVDDIERRDQQPIGEQERDLGPEDVAQLVGCLPDRDEVLDLIPSPKEHSCNCHTQASEGGEFDTFLGYVVSSRLGPHRKTLSKQKNKGTVI